MNVCFIQVADNQWVNIDTIAIIGASTSHPRYYIDIADGNQTEIYVPYDSEYAINVERLLRANHFGQLVLKERTGSDSGGTGCANGPEVSSFLGADK